MFFYERHGEPQDNNFVFRVYFTFADPEDTIYLCMLEFGIFAQPDPDLLHRGFLISPFAFAETADS